MDAENKKQINKILDELIDNDDLSYANSVKDYFSELNRVYDSLTKSGSYYDFQQCFWCAAFLLLMDQVSLDDLCKNPDIVNPIFYFSYCVFKGVKNIDMSPWTHDILEKQNNYNAESLRLYDKIDTANIESIIFPDNFSASDFFSRRGSYADFIFGCPFEHYNIQNIYINNGGGDDKDIIFDTYADVKIKNIICSDVNDRYIDTGNTPVDSLVLKSASPELIINIDSNKLSCIDLTNIKGIVKLYDNTTRTILSSDVKILKKPECKLRVQKFLVEKIKPLIQNV